MHVSRAFLHAIAAYDGYALDAARIPLTRRIMPALDTDSGGNIGNA